MTASATSSFRVHGPDGIVERATEARAPRRPAAGARTIAGAVPVTQIMSPDVVCASPDLDLDALVDIMVRGRLGCVPIVDERGRPLGMVTKLDIVEHLVAPVARALPLAADVMMPLALTLPGTATVAQAAALMASEYLHHLMIVSEGKLIGVVSTMDVTRWLADNDGIAA
jgi:CBS domain-containing protein